MVEKKKVSPYSPEYRERAVRMLEECRASYATMALAYREVASKLGCSADSLRAWHNRALCDEGLRPGVTSAEKARIKELEREVRELRQAHEILKKASAYFAQAERARELWRPFRK